MEDSKKIISFSVDEIQMQSLDEVNDSQFALGRLHCFASGQTSHKYRFSEEVLKEAEPTILKKPLLWNYSIWTDDCAGHEKSEVPCGFVPELNAEISYEKADDGRLFFCVNTFIWKLYSGKLIDILKKTDGYKHVSVELWILDSIEHPDEDYTEVTKFCYTGITVLGDDVNPAVKDADIQIIKFSEAKQDFENHLNVLIKDIVVNSETQESLLNINQKDESKEVTMAKNILENAAETTPEVMENAEKVVTTSVSITQDASTYTDCGEFIEGEHESHYIAKTTVEHIPNAPDGEMNAEQEQLDNGGETEDMKNSEEVVQENNSDEMPIEEKCSALELKCSGLEQELNMLKNQYSTLELKCSNLEEYKTNKETALKVKAIECALNDVSEVLSSDDMTQWREKSLQCENVDQFKNELKAFAYDLQKQKGVKPIETLRNSIPTLNIEISNNVWDRLAKQTLN